MLKIRLQRVGRKHEPAFRIVLTESKNSSKSGRLKEVLGSYDPRKTVDLIKVDRVKYWLEKGVKPTPTVCNLLVTHKLLSGPKMNVLPHKVVVKSAETTPTESPASDMVESAQAETA